MKKLDYIDSLRGIAILGVLMVHTNQYGGLPVSGMAGKVIGEAASGVQLFFLTSAFTLFLSFTSRSARETHPVRNFFIRRFFRIAPLYYVGVCYYLIQDGLGPRYWLGDEPRITTANILSNFTFLHGVNPYWITSIVPGGWSIGVEMLFYLLVPLLFLNIKNLNQSLLFFVGSTVVAVCLHQLLSKHPPIGSVRLWNEYLYFYFPSQLPVFSLGVVMYFIVARKETLTAVSGLSLLALSGLFLVQTATETAVIFPSHVLFGFGYLLLGIALSKTKLYVITNPLINHIGKVSFSMYIVHFAVLHGLQQANLLMYSQNVYLNFLLKYVVVLGATAAIATLLYRIIEVPFQNLGKKLIARLEREPAHRLEPLPSSQSGTSLR